MGNNINEYERIDLEKIINVICKNKYFIVTFLFLGVLFGVAFSGIQALLNPVEKLYQAKATIEIINAEEMSNQPQTVLYIIESRSILDSSMNNLGIINGNYMVRTSSSSKLDEYDVFVEGPDKKMAVSLVNEIISQGLAITALSMQVGKIEIINNGYINGNPIETTNGVNMTLNVIISLVLAGTVSIFLIYFIRYINGRVYEKDEVEKVLGTNVLILIPSMHKKNKYEKFIRVR